MTRPRVCLADVAIMSLGLKNQELCDRGSSGTDLRQAKSLVGSVLKEIKNKEFLSLTESHFGI